MMDVYGKCIFGEKLQFVNLKVSGVVFILLKLLFCTWGSWGEDMDGGGGWVDKWPQL